MSLRKQAKILGISPTYLSLILSGRRPWRGNLKERYEELVNTFVNTNDNGNRQRFPKQGISHGKEVVGGTGFEPVTSAMSTQRSKPLS